jgi:hypothetical protein
MARKLSKNQPAKKKQKNKLPKKWQAKTRQKKTNSIFENKN